MTTTDTALMERTITKPELDYIMAWRELWADHVYWTRFVIEGIVDKIGGLNETVERLFASCHQMRDLVRPYYGDQAAEGFGDLMTQHLQQAADLVSLAAEGKMQDAEVKERDWYENADAIAKFLAGANPYLEEGVVRDVLHEHLRVTKEEAVARLSKDYAGDVQKFDSILGTIYKLSDALSAAIIKQFPDRFAA
jgi:hypothetical protein